MGIEWPGKLVYTKAFFPLDMTPDKRAFVTAAVDITGSPNDYHEMKRVSLRLIDVKADRYEGDLFQAQESGVQESDEQSDEENDWALKNPRSVKSKNKAVNMERSVQGSESIFGMGGADETCNRCQKTGRWWGNRHEPFGRNVVFPKSKSSSKSGSDQGRKREREEWKIRKGSIEESRIHLGQC